MVGKFFGILWKQSLFTNMTAPALNPASEYVTLQSIRLCTGIRTFGHFLSAVTKIVPSGLSWSRTLSLLNLQSFLESFALHTNAKCAIESVTNAAQSVIASTVDVLFKKIARAGPHVVFAFSLF